MQIDWGLISNILTLITIILVPSGIVLLLYLTSKYENKAIENPKDAAAFRERRQGILKIYLRVVIIIFIAAIITAVLANM